MDTSANNTSRRIPKRSVWIAFSAAVLAGGTLIMAGGAGADNPDSGAVNRTEGASAALTEGATFFPVTPYRGFDSRSETQCTGEGGPLGPADSRIVDVVTDESCESKIPPENLVAVAYNLTVVSTVGRGYLAVFPPGTEWPGNSTINWAASGELIANGSVAQVGEAFEENGFIMVESGPNGSTDFIVDITGYYAE